MKWYHKHTLICFINLKERVKWVVLKSKVLKKCFDSFKSFYQGLFRAMKGFKLFSNNLVILFIWSYLWLSKRTFRLQRCIKNRRFKVRLIKSEGFCSNNNKNGWKTWEHIHILYSTHRMKYICHKLCFVSYSLAWMGPSRIFLRNIHPLAKTFPALLRGRSTQVLFLRRKVS